MAHTAVHIGIAGLGTVAQGLLSLLQENRDGIEEQIGRPFNVVRVASRTPKPDIDLLGAEFTTNLDELIQDDVEIVVELIGGTDAADVLISNALERNLSVVTANKAVMAARGNFYVDLARSRGLSLGFEASVAGGIPIIATIKNGLAGNTIDSLMGIINGTCNYILTEMDSHDASFAEALSDAQELGYAEMDPSFDIDGIDAAQKLAILGALAFNQPIDFDSIYVEGITNIEVEDLHYARQLGYRIKHVALACLADGSVEMRVHPALVPEKNTISTIDGVENAISVSGNGVGQLMLTGPGAGARPTASAVLGDIIEIARGKSSLPAQTSKSFESRNISDIDSVYYLNIPVADVPGVIAQIGDTLAQHNVSIESVIQKSEAVRRTNDVSWVPVVILTDKVNELTMDATERDLANLPHVHGRIRRIRVTD